MNGPPPSFLLKNQGDPGPPPAETERQTTGRPIAPLSMISRSFIHSLQKCRTNAICRTTPASAQACAIRSASATVSAIGFSQSTCLPA